jgi:hypothetical protein
MVITTMAMNLDQDEPLKAWADEYGLTTAVIDDGGAAMQKFGQGGFPSVSLFAPGHVLHYQGRDWESKIEEILPVPAE